MTDSIGLADGAGGNRSFGINPADFSRAVLDACRQLLQKTHFHSKQLPKLILSAMEQVEARKVRGKISQVKNKYSIAAQESALR